MSPKDEMKEFVQTLSEKLKNKYDGPKELGPDNSEARRLMEALQNTVDTTSFTPEDLDNAGVGKDYLGKYAFADIKYNGRIHRVTVRDIEDYENEGEKTNNLYPGTGRLH